MSVVVEGGELQTSTKPTSNQPITFKPHAKSPLHFDQPVTTAEELVYQCATRQEESLDRQERGRGPPSCGDREQAARLRVIHKGSTH